MVSGLWSVQMVKTEKAALQMVAEMPDGRVDTEELSDESAVRQLNFLQFC